jgi:fructose-bisphosphate aldolase class II
VYKPGNVVLTPSILDNSQKYIAEKFNTNNAKPVDFVFHGGSGSAQSEIEEALSYGVIKMNIDTDTQWATWEGVKDYYEKNRDYMQGQIGNPDGDDKPNKKYYDPRKWLRAGQETLVKRVELAFSDLNALNRN